jgi:hypothetical protein
MKFDILKCLICIAVTVIHLYKFAFTKGQIFAYKKEKKLHYPSRIR